MHASMQENRMAQEVTWFLLQIMDSVQDKTFLGPTKYKPPTAPEWRCLVDQGLQIAWKNDKQITIGPLKAVAEHMLELPADPGLPLVASRVRAALAEKAGSVTPLSTQEQRAYDACAVKDVVDAAQ